MGLQAVDAAELRRRLGSAAPAELSGSDLPLVLGTAGWLVLRPLAFDSELFAAPIARVIASGGDDLATLHREALAWARERGFRHLVCQLEASEIPAARALESAGYRLTDVVATFARAPAAFAASPLLVRAASDAEVELVADRCKAIFRAARFYTDPFYPPERADELHRRWILNCHRGGLADAFLVAVADGEVAGFSTCRLARPQLVGHMILLGVLPEFRRRGVGEALVGGTLRWFAERGAVEVRLRTQAVNQSAVNLYQRNGFRLARTELNFSFSDAP